MKIIGLTGGIGTGKSTVSNFLKELGAVVIDADKVGHEVFKPDTEAWREVVATFGENILTVEGEVDRKKLGKVVFGSRESLSRLNRIMHPRMRDMIKARIEEYRRQGEEVVVLEAAILLEAGWALLVDEIWMTVAPESTVLKRLTEYKGLRKEEVLARIRSQLSTAERAKHANMIIDTDCTLDELRTRVGRLWQKLQAANVPEQGV